MPGHIKIIDDNVSLSEMIKEVINLGDGPDFKIITGLEAVLSSAFADTQSRTHIITGSLQASGKTASDYKKATRTWSGEITYGGSSPGPNNPVDYAIYEMARGGDHDFFGGLINFYPQFDEAINKHWKLGS